MAHTCNRRSFLQSVAVLSAMGMAPAGAAVSPAGGLIMGPRPKKPAIVRGAFFYPPEQVVLDGQCEDNWAKHQWFTWPGNQFKPEEQQAKFVAKLDEITSHTIWT